MVCDGIELLDTGSLRDFYVQPLSTIRIVILNNTTATSSSSSTTNAASTTTNTTEAEEDENNLITDEEMPRSLVITGIPQAEPSITEKAIFDMFSGYGPITRVIFQSSNADPTTVPQEPTNETTPTNNSGSFQHAVLIFAREASAVASLVCDKQDLLGAPVHVILATTLAPPPPPPSSTSSSSDSSVPQTFHRPTFASAVVADMIAQGYLYGVQGVAHLKRVDADIGVSQRVSVIDGKVRSSVSSTYEAAKNQALEIDRVYHIRAKVEDAARIAKTQAEIAGRIAMTQATALANRAMQNPTVANTVHQATNVISNVFSQAKAEAHYIGARVTARVDAARGQVVQEHTDTISSNPVPSGNNQGGHI